MFFLFGKRTLRQCLQKFCCQMTALALQTTLALKSSCTPMPVYLWMTLLSPLFSLTFFVFFINISQIECFPYSSTLQMDTEICPNRMMLILIWILKKSYWIYDNLKALNFLLNQLDVQYTCIHCIRTSIQMIITVLSWSNKRFHSKYAIKYK